MSTKERLAQRLHSLGLFDLERRARAGEWSDYESRHACPKIELVGELKKIYDTKSPIAEEAFKLAREVMYGQWDDTKEEAAAWWEKEGKGLLS